MPIVRRLHSVQTRYLLIVVLALMIPAMAGLVINLFQTRDTLEQVIDTNFRQVVADSATNVESLLLESQADALFLAQSVAVRRYITESRNTRESDTLDAARPLLPGPRQSPLDGLADYATLFLRRYSDRYSGVCLIDNLGNEVLCIESRSGITSRQPDDQLTNRFDANYFTEPMTLTGIPGESVPVYVSDIETNANGQQVIRFSVLLQSDIGEIVGVLVLQADLSDLWSRITCDLAACEIHLLDSEGRTLLTSAQEPVTRYERGRGDLAAVLTQNDAVWFAPAGYDNLLLGFARIRPPGQAVIQWTLVYERPLDQAMGGVYDAQTAVIAVTLGGLVAAMILALLLLQSVMQPIRQLTRSAEMIAAENWDTSIPGTRRGDEIGLLANAFATMRDEIRRLIGRLRERVGDLEEARQQLADSEHRYRTITELMSDFAMHIVINDQGERTLHWVTPSVERITGYTLKPDATTTLAVLVDAFHPADRPRLMADLNAAASGLSHSGDYRFVHYEGHQIWLRMSQRPEFDSGGQRVIGIYAAVQDVTEERLHQAARQRSDTLNKAMLEALPDMLFRVDQAYRFVAVHRGTEADTSLEAANLIGSTLQDALPRTTAAALQAAVDAALLTRAAQSVIYELNGQKGLRWYEARVVPLGSVEALILVRDVSEQRRAQQVMQDANAELERRVQERTAALSEKNAQLEMEIALRRQTEDALRQRESQLRLLTDNASDLICLHEPDGRYRYVSPSAQHILGYAPDDLVGHTPWAFRFEEDRDLELRFMQAASGEVESAMTYRIKRQDGRPVWLETVFQPVYDDDGSLLSIVAVSRDISERLTMQTRIQDSQRFLEASLDALTALIAVLDENGYILSVNQAWKAFCEVYGSDEPLIQGVGLHYVTAFSRLLADPGSQHRLGEAVREMLAGRLDDFRMEYQMAAEQPARWYALRITRFSYDGLPRLVVAHTDINDQKLVEQDFQRALAQEQELNRMRTQFVSMISHDFRTPLSAIQTTADLLMRYQSRFTLAEMRVRLGRIQSSVQHLDSLLDDIVYITRSAADDRGLDLQPVDLDAYFQDIIADVELATNDEGRVIYSATLCGPQAEIDAHLIHKILGNLLANALKYSSEAVVFDVQCDGGWLHLLVQDKGIGIPESDQARLYETFHRGANVGTRPGTGLGLAIVKQAVDSYGGRLALTSVEGEGTSVTVSLPLLHAPTP